MGKMKAVITFDTTGSMYTCLRDVRVKAQDLVRLIFNQANDVEIAVIAHGDYCDANHPYVTKCFEFSNDPDKLCEFIREVKATSGGDVDECYSLVLHEIASMEWDDADVRMAIVIGDANPHKKGYKYGSFTEEYDWMEETDKLAELGVNIYAVHALANYRKSSKKFYETIAKKTDGKYVTLNNLADIADIIVAASLYVSDDQAYNDFIDTLKEKRISRTLAESIHDFDKNFVYQLIVGDADLSDVDDYGSDFEYDSEYDSESDSESDSDTSKKKTKTGSKSGSKRKRSKTSSHKMSGVRAVVKGEEIDLSKLEPVLPGKYQQIYVEKDSTNKELFADFGPKFKTGLIYYELVKSEEVSPKKHVIIMDKDTGDLYSGDEARTMIGLRPYDPTDSTKDRIKASDLGNLVVYIQSTSVNRKHKAGSTILFELGDL